MKHGGRPELARRLGRILQDAISRAFAKTSGPPIDTVLPVPLHPLKLRRRGFNQALELARVALGRLRERSPRSTPFPSLDRQLLLRTRNTRELGHSGPGARRVEVDGAFRVSDPNRVAGRRFLVVDDVLTTGATLNECAKTLVQAGAAEIRVVALARAV
jgi:predicted amidophosphoribosyltransferase